MYDIAQFNEKVRKSRIGQLVGGAVSDVGDAYKQGGIGRGIGAAVRNNLSTAMLAPAAAIDDVKQIAAPVTNFAGEVGRGILGIDGPATQGAPATVAAPAAAAAAAVPPRPPLAAPQSIVSPAQQPQQTQAGGYGMAQGGVVGAQTSVPGITKLTGGGFKSPMFTDDPARAMAESSKGPGVNTVPAASFNAPSPGATAGVSAALQAAAARGDFQSIADFYQRGGGTFNGATAAQDKIAALGKTITAPNGNMTVGDMLAAKGRNKLAQSQISSLKAQPGLDAQAAQMQAQAQGILAGIPLTQAKTKGELVDADLKQKQAALVQQLADADPSDTEKIAALKSKLSIISGKAQHDQADKYILADVDTGQVDAMGQPIFKKVPFNQRTGEYAPITAVAGDKEKKKNDIAAQFKAKKINEEEARAQLAALGYK